MGRILNHLIVILVIILLIIGGFILYKYITFEKYTITFTLNGASYINSKQKTCSFSLRGCIIELPQVVRDDGTIIGYNFDKDAHDAKYYPGDKLSINKDYDLYAISYKEIVISIDKNNTDYLEKDKLNCVVYNTGTSCKIKMPLFNKKGYQLEGYSEQKEIGSALKSYFQNQEYEFDHSMTLYPNYNSKRSDKKSIVYNTNEVYFVKDNSTIMEFENGLSQNTISNYKKIVDDIYNHWPYYFTGTKISIISSNTFQNVWGGNGSILGVNYSKGASNDYPISRSLDAIVLSKNDYMTNYYVLVHELGHSFDQYYGYALNKPKVITKDYYSKYSTHSIGAQSDMLSLYNKYKVMYTRPLRKYAYTSIHEFVAESFAYYYLTFVVPTEGYDSAKYPNDLKQVVEKYLCVAKHDYDTSQCIK